MLVDWFCILVWVAITAAIGVPLYLSGVTHSMGAVTLNLMAALIMVVPVTVGLTLLESSAREASVGKRTRQLRVVDAVHGVASVISAIDSSEHPEDRRALDHWARCGVLHRPGKRIRTCPRISLATDRRGLRAADHVRRLPLCGQRTHSIRPRFRNRRHPGSSPGYIVVSRSACGTDQAWAGRSSAYDGSHDAT